MRRHRSLSVVMLLCAAWSSWAADEGPTPGKGQPAAGGAPLGSNQPQHAGAALAMAFSPDGKWLASAGADKVRVWDAQTGKASLSLEGHDGAVLRVAFIPTGKGQPAKVLISAGVDKTIRFWDLRTGKKLPHIINHASWASALAISPDGKLIASGGPDAPDIFLWRAKDGKLERRWKAHQGGIDGLAFAPDGKTIVSAGIPEAPSPEEDAPKEKKDNYGTALWETDTGRRRQTIPVWRGPVAFSADGKLLASSITFWDPKTGKELGGVGDSFFNPVGDARAMALTSDGKTLAIAALGDHRGIRLFDTGTGAEQRGMVEERDSVRRQKKLRAATRAERLAMVREDVPEITALAFSPDGLTLAAADEQGRINLWDVGARTRKFAAPGKLQPPQNPAKGEPPVRTDVHGEPLPPYALARLGTSQLQHDGQVLALVYSPNGKWLASAGDDCVIRVWAADSGKAVFNLEGHEEPVYAVAFVPTANGKPANVLVSASLDKTIRFWDLQTGKALPKIINHHGTAAALAVSPDGKLLASGGYDASHIFVWRVEDGKEVHRWRAHRGGVVNLAFAPDGKSVVSSGIAQRQTFPPDEEDKAPKDNYSAAVWQADNGQLRYTLAAYPRAIAFSADGKLLASLDFADTAGPFFVLRSAKTGKTLGDVGDGFGLNSPHCLALAKDSKTVAISEIGQIKLFDVGSGAETTRWADMQAQVMAFSPDGSTLAAAGGEKGRIMLWDVTQRIEKHFRHLHPINSVAVSPDGKTIVTTSFSEAAWLWDRATCKSLRQLKHEKIGGMTWSSAFSPDSRSVALAHHSDGITFWDIGTGQLKRQIKASFCVSLAFSPDGKALAAESIEQPCLFDTATGKLKAHFPRGTNPDLDRPTSVAISPDGRLLASGARSGLKVWRVDGPELVFDNTYLLGTSVAFSPGGWLLAASGNGASIFEAANGKVLETIPGLHPRSSDPNSREVAFSPDGQLLAIADRTRITLWEVAARRKVRSFLGHRGIVTSVTFTPDGKALVSASEDGTALVWDVSDLLPSAGEQASKVQWSDLHSDNRLHAYAAYCRLRASPNDAITLLRNNLKPTPAASAERLADLIKKLDDNSFKVRDAASQELMKLGLSAEKALRQARRGKLSLEAGQCIDRLLAHLDADANWQINLTGFKLLEELPIAIAGGLLEDLARGDADCRWTREANTALQRIRKHGAESKP